MQGHCRQHSLQLHSSLSQAWAEAQLLIGEIHVEYLIQFKATHVHVSRNAQSPSSLQLWWIPFWSGQPRQVIGTRTGNIGHTRAGGSFFLCWLAQLYTICVYLTCILIPRLDCISIEKMMIVCASVKECTRSFKLRSMFHCSIGIGTVAAVAALATTLVSP